jgi:hypothetical protein
VLDPTKVRKVPQDSCQLPGRKGFSAIPELPRRDLVYDAILDEPFAGFGHLLKAEFIVWLRQSRSRWTRNARSYATYLAAGTWTVVAASKMVTFDGCFCETTKVCLNSTVVGVTC